MKRILAFLLLLLMISIGYSAKIYTEKEAFEAEVRKAPKIESNLVRKNTTYKNKYSKYLLLKIKESNKSLY
ncbi:MAG: hypothetical protein JXR56_01195 [Candidatus Cloacimonetes bacterium]|nr:hypothetical protein [Candidatus Cloacimonadota bacterium]